MTFKTFKNKWEESLKHKSPYIRKGQSLMSFLAEIWLEEYKRITSTDYDCFYSDKLINNTLEHLEKVWVNYRNSYYD
jgi:hypothetical protein